MDRETAEILANAIRFLAYTIQELTSGLGLLADAILAAAVPGMEVWLLMIFSALLIKLITYVVNKLLTEGGRSLGIEVKAILISIWDFGAFGFEECGLFRNWLGWGHNISSCWASRVARTQDFWKGSRLRACYVRIRDLFVNIGYFLRARILLTAIRSVVRYKKQGQL
ncbi:uncharacterized protein PgNI_07314 [Pyricularia grisea]|uniref:Uncharacterized protein n=1 Tax=Pyricularia grisea TaxID=148305 RepID=A0A6P8B1H2_PYRGI|nr:uncharacterized protein PgNI_07314 [Pyricularia grisea]TLD08679.1 hypothetical protein PgNI_07314 [Pyricularia grisea]